MKIKSVLTTTVFISALVSAPYAAAQSGSPLIINPMPDVQDGPVHQPSDDVLMPPVEISEQKVRDERSLLDSIVVPEPGSDYFSAAPVESDEEPPSEEALAPVEMSADDASEYESWAAEQRARYQQQDAVRLEPTMEVEEPAVNGNASVPARPTAYSSSSQQRLSNAPEIQEQIRGVAEDSSVNTTPVVTQTDWNALEGNSIRQVLERWTAQAGVELIWRSDSDFAVLNPFIMRATFERAVQKLLDQYQDNQVRPVATLHIDPDTTSKTLLVRVIEQ